ncbi:CYFA0S16e02256g1_1 [Cyberlindnera fabianii]|uniref:CYFA0S16e02256g1_1 n=1 Tax=Cyberlindnera fabianii TaxID=36022 RepID=A0A061BDR9_CYBFA|nr:CYFA0S16e02256g1_1 [Cyberlindnera fabianii]
MANHVIELQKLYQSSTKPLWMRHPRSKFYIYPFWGLFWSVNAVTTYYLGRAVLGIKDPKK